MDELSTRLRARIIEALRLIADDDVQRKYESEMPEHNVTNELFNQWDDAFHPDHEQFRRAFTADELTLLEQFGETIDAVDSQTPQELPSLSVFLASEPGRMLSKAARHALARLKQPPWSEPHE
jgi:hypothetical protein